MAFGARYKVVLVMARRVAPVDAHLGQVDRTGSRQGRKWVRGVAIYTLGNRDHRAGYRIMRNVTVRAPFLPAWCYEIGPIGDNFVEGVATQANGFGGLRL